MISIDQWRGRIGSFNGIKAYSKPTGTNDGSLLSASNSLGLIQIVMAGVVISMLLIIGGIEANPGPPTVAQGNKQKY